MTCASQQDMGNNKLFYAVSGAPQHDRQPHPETARRVPAILAALERTGVTSPAHADKVLQHHILNIAIASSICWRLADNCCLCS